MSKDKWFLNGGRGSGKTFRLLCQTYEDKIAELEKDKQFFSDSLDKQIEATLKLQQENEELKVDNAFYKRACEGAAMMYKHLTKAKELLRYYFDCFKNDNKYTLSDFEVVEDTEQFLSEV